MDTLQADLQDFRRMLEKGSVQRAYRALIDYMLDLRTHFSTKHAVSGLYQGYMDMTYFALFPPALKRHNLKVAIVFNYRAFRLEAWLAAGNRKLQRQYWEQFKDSRWPSYRVVAPASGVDSIVECDLASDFNLNDPDSLTLSIETATDAFIDNMEKYLSEH